MRLFIDHLGISGKIIVGNTLPLAVLVLGMVAALWQGWNISADITRLRLGLTPLHNAVSDTHSAGARLMAETQTHATFSLLGRQGDDAHPGADDDRLPAFVGADLIAGEQEQMGDFRDRLRDGMAAVEAARERATGDATAGHPEVASAVARLRSVVDALVANAAELNQLAGSAPPAETLERLEELEVIEREFDQTIHQLSRTVAEDAAMLQESIDYQLRAALWMFGMALLVGIVVIGIGSYFVAGYISGPIVALRDTARRFGAGDLAIRPARASADEIGELETAFAKMAQDLTDSIERQTRQSRLAALGELAGTVNHELRNPLSTICNSMITLRRRVPADETETVKLIDRIDRNVERCVHIVGDFLDFARPPVAARTPTRFDAWLEAVLDEYPFPESIEVERALGAPITIELDGERFRRVILNLLDNAVQAMTDAAWQPQAGAPRRISVHTAVFGQELQLSLADTGPGIRPEHLDKLFEPLFTTKSFGIGLGLAAVRRIVGQHDGTIAVDGSAGPGVCFTIRLPLARQDMRGTI